MFRCTGTPAPKSGTETMHRSLRDTQFIGLKRSVRQLLVLAVVNLVLTVIVVVRVFEVI